MSFLIDLFVLVQNDYLKHSYLLCLHASVVPLSFGKDTHTDKHAFLINIDNKKLIEYYVFNSCTSHILIEKFFLRMTLKNL